MWIRYRAYFGFALLCLVTSSRWLLEGARPEAASTPLSQVLGAALAAVLLFALAGMRPAGTKQAGTPWRVLCGAILVLGGPTLARSLAGGRLHANDASLALALVPVVIAVGRSGQSTEAASDLPGQLWPGLVGIAGLLLLLPEPQAAGWRGWAGLACLPVFVGVGAVLVSAGRKYSSRWALPAGALASAGLFLLAGGVGPLPPLRAFPFYASGLDGALMSLSLLVLIGLQPQQWSAQFSVIPLLALLESILLLRPLVDARSWLGLALLAAGSLRLLVGGPEELLAKGTLDLTTEGDRLPQP